MLDKLFNSFQNIDTHEREWKNIAVSHKFLVYR